MYIYVYIHMWKYMLMCVWVYMHAYIIHTMYIHTALHYIAKQFTLQFYCVYITFTLHLNYICIRFTIYLPYIYITFALLYIPFLYITYYITVHCSALQCTELHHIILHYFDSNAFHCIWVLCSIISSHYIASILQCITFHYIMLHYLTWHTGIYAYIYAIYVCMCIYMYKPPLHPIIFPLCCTDCLGGNYQWLSHTIRHRTSGVWQGGLLCARDLLKKARDRPGRPLTHSQVSNKSVNIWSVYAFCRSMIKVLLQWPWSTGISGF